MTVSKVINNKGFNVKLLKKITRDLCHASSSIERDIIIEDVSRQLSEEEDSKEAPIKQFLINNIQHFWEICDTKIENSTIFPKIVFFLILPEYDNYISNLNQIDDRFVDVFFRQIGLPFTFQQDLWRSILKLKKKFVDVLRYILKFENSTLREDESVKLREILENQEIAFVWALLKDHSPLIAFKVVEQYIKSSLCRWTLPDTECKVSRIYKDDWIPKSDNNVSIWTLEIQDGGNSYSYAVINPEELKCSWQMFKTSKIQWHHMLYFLMNCHYQTPSIYEIYLNNMVVGWTPTYSSLKIAMDLVSQNNIKGNIKNKKYINRLIKLSNKWVKLREILNLGKKSETQYEKSMTLKVCKPFLLSRQSEN